MRPLTVFPEDRGLSEAERLSLEAQADAKL
jgi:hypothetical protein